MPCGVSMTRFSTTPLSVTRITRARPGLRLTSSMCFSGLSVFGASTSPAYRDSPESADVASSSNSSRSAPEPAHWASMCRRSSSVRLPTSRSPSTNSRRPASVGMRPADVWGANNRPDSSRSAMTLRMVAGDRAMVSRRARVREPMGSPVSR